MLPENVLYEPVSRDWPLVCFELLAWCPGAEDPQGTADVAFLNTCFTGSETLRTATFLCGCLDNSSLEIVVP